MRLLLDESVPMQLRSLFVGHDVSTVRHMGWGTIDPTPYIDSSTYGPGYVQGKATGHPLQ